MLIEHYILRSVAKSKTWIQKFRKHVGNSHFRSSQALGDAGDFCVKVFGKTFCREFLCLVTVHMKEKHFVTFSDHFNTNLNTNFCVHHRRKSRMAWELQPPSLWMTPFINFEELKEKLEVL